MYIIFEIHKTMNQLTIPSSSQRSDLISLFDKLLLVSIFEVLLLILTLGELEFVVLLEAGLAKRSTYFDQVLTLLTGLSRSAKSSLSVSRSSIVTRQSILY